MSEDSLAHRIHVSLGNREQLAYLRNQNLVAGPMGYAGAQVSGVPAATFEDMHMTNEGLAWAAAGFPVL